MQVQGEGDLYGLVHDMQISLVHLDKAERYDKKGRKVGKYGANLHIHHT